MSARRGGSVTPRHDTTALPPGPRPADRTRIPLRFSGSASRMLGRVSSGAWGEGAQASAFRSGDEAPVGIQVSRIATQAAARFLPGSRPSRSPSRRRAAGNTSLSCPFTTPRRVLETRCRQRARPPGDSPGAPHRPVLPHARVVPLQLPRIGTDVPNSQPRGLLSGRDPVSEYRRDSRPHAAQYATRYGLEVFRCRLEGFGRARQVWGSVSG